MGEVQEECLKKKAEIQALLGDMDEIPFVLRVAKMENDPVGLFGGSFQVPYPYQPGLI
jgi:hypothetical protein